MLPPSSFSFLTTSTPSSSSSSSSSSPSISSISFSLLTMAAFFALLCCMTVITSLKKKKKKIKKINKENKYKKNKNHKIKINQYKPLNPLLLRLNFQNRLRRPKIPQSRIKIFPQHLSLPLSLLLPLLLQQKQRMRLKSAQFFSSSNTLRCLFFSSFII